MRAVVLREFGDPTADGAVIAIEERDEPGPGDGDGQIVVDLLAADLQPLDRQIARGFLPGSGPLPMIAGVSAVGRTVGSGRTVVVLGEVTGRGITRDGLFADRFAVDASQIADRAAAARPARRRGRRDARHARPPHAVRGRRRPSRPERPRARRDRRLRPRRRARPRTPRGSTSSPPRVAPSRSRRPKASTSSGSTTSPTSRRAVRDLTGGHGVDVIVDPLGGAVTGAAARAGARACRHVLLGHTAGADATRPGAGDDAERAPPARRERLPDHRSPTSTHYLREALADMATGHHRPADRRRSRDLAEAAAGLRRGRAVHGRTILVGAALGDADHGGRRTPRPPSLPRPGRHDHHHGDATTTITTTTARPRPTRPLAAEHRAPEASMV